MADSKSSSNSSSFFSAIGAAGTGAGGSAATTTDGRKANAANRGCSFMIEVLKSKVKDRNARPARRSAAASRATCRPVYPAAEGRATG